MISNELEQLSFYLQQPLYMRIRKHLQQLVMAWLLEYVIIINIIIIIITIIIIRH